jgi:hypothetical protein
MFHGYSAAYQDAASSMWHALEAKFMAEKAPGVGESTVALNCDFRRQFPFRGMMPNNVDTIRGIWESGGKPRYPKEAKEKLDKWFENKESIKQLVSQTSEPER